MDVDQEAENHLDGEGDTSTLVRYFISYPISQTVNEIERCWLIKQKVGYFHHRFISPKGSMKNSKNRIIHTHVH